MSASKADKSRFWVAIFLDEITPGLVFQPGLLHITLSPWFVTEVADDYVINAFKSSFSGSRKFSLQLGENVFFGPSRNVGVTLVKPCEALMDMHQKSLEVFSQVEGRWSVQNAYVGADFTPHIRRRRGRRLQLNQIINVRAIDLITARREEDHVRALAAKIELR